MASGPVSSLPSNGFKAALREGRPQIGLWTAMCSPIATEIVAGAGFDWVVIDTEHAPNELPDVLAQLHAMGQSSAEPVVRCAWNDAVIVKRFLDIGARSLLVPFVQTLDDAQRAVAATRYPPLGNRGVSMAPRANRYGRIPDYHRGAHREVCVVVQLETRAGLQNLDDIAALEGIDGVFIGPSDLAADMGHLGNSQHAEVQDAIVDACRRVRGAGKAAGILTPDVEAATRYLDLGFSFVAVGSDVGVLAKGTAQLAAHFKQLVERSNTIQR